MKGKATICVLPWRFYQTLNFFQGIFMYSNCIATMLYLISYPFKSLPWTRSALLLIGCQLKSVFWWQQWLWHRTLQIRASKRTQNLLAQLIRTDLQEGTWDKRVRSHLFGKIEVGYTWTIFVSMTEFLMELQINQFWIWKGHGTINSANEYNKPDVLNTSWTTRVQNSKVYKE